VQDFATMPARRFWIITLAAAAVGVALRFVYVLGTLRGRTVLVSDSLTFHRLGKVLADGRGYIRANEFVEDGLVIPTAEFPPVYPMLLAGLDLVGVGQPTGQRLAGAVIGGITIVVIALLGEAVAGRTVGAVAAVIAAGYPQLVVFDGALLSEGPYALMVATALLAVVRARAAEPDERRRWWILASVATGLAVMTRTEALLLVPLLIVPATRAPGDAKAWARAALLASAGTLLLLGAWTTRNAVTLDRFLPLTNNSGTLLAGANCDATYSGVQIGGWRFDCVPIVDYTVVDETTAAENRRAVGLDYMGDHAGEVPVVMAARLGRTFGVWDVRVNLFFESLEGRDFEWLWAAWYAWLALAPLAAAGAVLQRRAGRELWPLLVPFVIVIATTMLSYGTQRFRMMAEPSVVVLAAVSVVAIAGWIAGRISDAGEDRADLADGQAQAPAGSS